MKMLTAVSILLMAGAAQASTLAVIGLDDHAHYHGVGDPTPGVVYDYDLTMGFSEDHETVVIDFVSNSPSGRTMKMLHWEGMDSATGRPYSSNDQTFQMTLLGGPFDDLNASNFASLVQSVNTNWYDPQFQVGMFDTSLQTHPDKAPTILFIPEPTSFVLLALGGILLVILFRRRSGVVMSLVLLAIIVLPTTIQAQETPLGFELVPQRDGNALTFEYWPDTGKVILWGASNHFFHSAYLRSLSGQFTPPCTYTGPDYVCSENVMTRVLAFEEGDPPDGALFTHWEERMLKPGLRPTDLLGDLWVGGITHSNQRTPQGIKILPDDDFYVGTGPDLVVHGFVPEPSSVALLGMGTLLLIAIERRGLGKR